MSTLRSIRRLAFLAAVVVVPTTTRPSIALGQGTLTPADAQMLRSALLADLETVRGKFVQLADAFPQDKYSWRPMEGVRSVSDVLMLAAVEGYAFIPASFGGQRANLGAREEMQKLMALSDKAAVKDHLMKGFAHAKQQLETVDDATLGASRNLFGESRNAPGIAMGVFGDLHEHLGQLIAYARMNQVVPPWSK